jgi:hypothetical protein
LDHLLGPLAQKGDGRHLGDDDGRIPGQREKVWAPIVWTFQMEGIAEPARLQATRNIPGTLKDEGVMPVGSMGITL